MEGIGLNLGKQELREELNEGMRESEACSLVHPLYWYTELNTIYNWTKTCIITINYHWQLMHKIMIKIQLNISITNNYEQYPSLPQESLLQLIYPEYGYSYNTVITCSRGMMSYCLYMEFLSLFYLTGEGVWQRSQPPISHLFLGANLPCLLSNSSFNRLAPVGFSGAT